MNDVTLDPLLLGVVSIISAIQSVFGVGVLLFGTPVLLVYGYEFSEILTILLPISMGISLLQIVRDYRHIDTVFFRRVLLFTIPLIVLFLLIALQSGKGLGLLVGAMLLIYALRGVSRPLNGLLERFSHHETVWLLLTGAVHGLTNLGGSMLTIVVSQKQYGKDVSRTTIAAAYFTFALFQLLTLLVHDRQLAAAMAGNGPYVLTGAVTYVLTNSLIYRRLSNEIYAKAFSVLLFCSGVIVTFRSL